MRTVWLWGRCIIHFFCLLIGVSLRMVCCSKWRQWQTHCIASLVHVLQAIANAFLESAYDAYCILQPEAGIMSAVSARLDLQIPESGLWPFCPLPPWVIQGVYSV